jgi:hypothetical protein
VLELRNREACAPDVLERGTVAVATVPDADLDALKTVLPASEPRVLRAHVLEKDEPAIRFEDPVDPSECPLGIVDGAQDERGDGARTTRPGSE